jgi:hypothetical protein
MEQYHYLGYQQPIGEYLKYLVKASGQVIAYLVWQSAPRHLKVRDRYWHGVRKRASLTCNCEPTTHAIDSAMGSSRALSLAPSGPHGHADSTDWQRLYEHPINWLETFVDTSRKSLPSGPCRGAETTRRLPL